MELAQKDVTELFRSVWDAAVTGDSGLDLAMAKSLHRFPLLLALYFDAAARVQFTADSDLRLITKWIRRGVLEVPEWAQHESDPRACEALARAAVCDEVDLLLGVPRVSRDLCDTLLVAARCFFRTLRESPEAVERLRSVIVDSAREFCDPSDARSRMVSIVLGGEVNADEYRGLAERQREAVRSVLAARR